MMYLAARIRLLVYPAREFVYKILYNYRVEVNSNHLSVVPRLLELLHFGCAVV